MTLLILFTAAQARPCPNQPSLLNIGQLPEEDRGAVVQLTDIEGLSHLRGKEARMALGLAIQNLDRGGLAGSLPPSALVWVNHEWQEMPARVREAFPVSDRINEARGKKRRLSQLATCPGSWEKPEGLPSIAPMGVDAVWPLPAPPPVLPAEEGAITSLVLVEGLATAFVEADGISALTDRSVDLERSDLAYGGTPPRRETEGVVSLPEVLGVQQGLRVPTIPAEVDSDALEQQRALTCLVYPPGSAASFVCRLGLHTIEAHYGNAIGEFGGAPAHWNALDVWSDLARAVSEASRGCGSDGSNSCLRELEQAANPN